jgi:hypothetical protein
MIVNFSCINRTIAKYKMLLIVISNVQTLFLTNCSTENIARQIVAYICCFVRVSLKERIDSHSASKLQSKQPTSFLWGLADRLIASLALNY